MKVQIGDKLYYATFTNRSERIEHDAPPPALVALARENRQHLRLKTPKRISVITTTCTITDASDPERKPVCPPGKAFYSRTEITDGVPFDRRKAREKSLHRALDGDQWHGAEKRAFWMAFAELGRKRPIADHTPTH